MDIFKEISRKIITPIVNREKEVIYAALFFGIMAGVLYSINDGIQQGIIQAIIGVISGAFWGAVYNSIKKVKEGAIAGAINPQSRGIIAQGFLGALNNAILGAFMAFAAGKKRDKTEINVKTAKKNQQN